MSSDIHEQLKAQFEIKIVNVLPNVLNLFLQPKQDNKNAGSLLEEIKNKQFFITTDESVRIPLAYEEKHQAFVAYAVQGVSEKSVLNGDIEIEITN